MPKETFHTQEACDRCSGSLAESRIMSWFNDDTICPKCSLTEKRLKAGLRENGLDSRDFEGCGYIPTPDGKRPSMP